MARRDHRGGGSDYGTSAGRSGAKGENGRPMKGWAPDPGWGSSWDDRRSARNGGGLLLVHETHAPKRISHIQFGLLSSEVGQEGIRCVNDAGAFRIRMYHCCPRHAQCSDGEENMNRPMDLETSPRDLPPSGDGCNALVMDHKVWRLANTLRCLSLPRITVAMICETGCAVGLLHDPFLQLKRAAGCCKLGAENQEMMDIGQVNFVRDGPNPLVFDCSFFGRQPFLQGRETRTGSLQKSPSVRIYEPIDITRKPYLLAGC